VNGAKKAPHSSSINQYKGFQVFPAFVGTGQHSGKLANNFSLTTQLLDLRHVRERGNKGGTGMTKAVGRAIHWAVLAGALAVALGMGGCANTPNVSQAAGMATPGSQQDFVVNVGDRVFFESDSTELTSQSVATLEKQAQWLQAYGQYTFTIEGHADERGTREYNIALGARRAQTVRDYLASRGVNAQRVRTISYGKERPVAVCNDISCWSQNRRAVTVLNTSS
jgi:peptidoglycan-associated lipoprotein